MQTREVSWDELRTAFCRLKFGTYDCIVAIAQGGIIPAALLQRKLQTPMEIIWLNLRDSENRFIADEPVLLRPVPPITGKNLLLVDDVSRTGRTLKKAKELLAGYNIRTFVINGEADYSLFHEEACLTMPWVF